jgi:hypothetical protein
MIQDMFIVAIGASADAVQFMICKVSLLNEMKARLLHLIFSGVCIEAGAVQSAPMHGTVACSFLRDFWNETNFFGYILRLIVSSSRGRHLSVALGLKDIVLTA